MDKLWVDLKNDSERAEFLRSGRAWQTGIISMAIQDDVADAFEFRAARQKAAESPENSPASPAQHTELAIAARGVVQAFDLGYGKEPFELTIKRLREALQQQAGR